VVLGMWVQTRGAEYFRFSETWLEQWFQGSVHVSNPYALLEALECVVASRVRIFPGAQ
jgi:hypothetical protein